uniref:Mitochondrial carrier protein n=3 Tax=Hemiselmis andersenii TaxID=464988 RepID=A0A6U4ULH9_HEMAN|mmetsp:Transcript_5564/g.12838  ORF Transcript_5564/g.12838 Transcript_5564/m.12838 type:complete len:321 (+) Transcript_5564:29-991(+)
MSGSIIANITAASAAEAIPVLKKEEWMSEQTKNDLVRLVMAGVSSTVAQCCVHGVETIKVRMQVEGNAPRGPGVPLKYPNVYHGGLYLYQHEGVAGLYKGITAAALREMSYSSLRFGLYEPFKRMLGETDPSKTELWVKFTAGALAGIAGSALANPTDVLKVRMQAAEGPSRPMMSHVREVLADGGWKAFYRGVNATIIRAAILNATKLAAYDETKYMLKRNGILEEGMQLHFVASMFAGVMVAATTSPVDLIRTRIMNQPKGEKHYNGMLDCLRKVVRSEGIWVLYRGFTPQWMRFGPFTIIQFMVWERMRALYGMKGI